MKASIVFLAAIFTTEHLSVLGWELFGASTTTQTSAVGNDSKHEKNLLLDESFGGDDHNFTEYSFYGDDHNFTEYFAKNDDIFSSKHTADHNFENFTEIVNNSSDAGNLGAKAGGFVDKLTGTFQKAMDFISNAFSSSRENENHSSVDNFNSSSLPDEINTVSPCNPTTSDNCSSWNSNEIRNEPTIPETTKQVQPDGTGDQFTSPLSIPSPMSPVKSTTNDPTEAWVINSSSEDSWSLFTPKEKQDTKTSEDNLAKTSTEDSLKSTTPTSSRQQQQPTWIDAGGLCFSELVRSEESTVCMIKNKTVESALLDIFNDTIIKKLTRKCMPGEWCLHHHPHWKQEFHKVQEFCSALLCIENLKSSDDCPTRRTIRNSLDLLCNLTKAEVSSPCLVSVRMMTHVIIADVIRTMIQTEAEELFCYKTEDKEKCIGSCRKSSNDLHCMCSSCNHNTTLFEGVAEWRWLFEMNNATEKCRLDKSDCSLFDTHSTADPIHHALSKLMMNNEWQLVAGLTITVVFSLLVVCGVFVMIRMRCSRNRRLQKRILRQSLAARTEESFRDDVYARDRVQYTIITTQPDDYDDYDD